VRSLFRLHLVSTNAAAFLALLTASVLLVPAGLARAFDPPPATVSFKGTGTFTSNVPTDLAEDENVNDHFSWGDARYTTTLNEDGTLAEADGYLLSFPTVGNYAFTFGSQPGGTACNGPLYSVNYAAPHLSSVPSKMVGTLELLVDSIPALDGDTSHFQGCTNPADPQDTGGWRQFSADWVTSVNSWLPDALRADFMVQLITPPEDSSHGPLVHYVNQTLTQADSLATPVPPDCGAPGGGHACELNWTGTVKVSVQCDDTIASVTDALDGHELSPSERQSIGMGPNVRYTGQVIDTRGIPNGVKVTNSFGDTTVQNGVSEANACSYGHQTTLDRLKQNLRRGYEGVKENFGSTQTDVSTDVTVVMVHGTSYEVWHDPTTGTTHDHLISGAMDVTDKTGSPTTVSLSPGDYVTTVAGGGPPRITGHDTGTPAACGASCFPTGGSPDTTPPTTKITKLTVNSTKHKATLKFRGHDPAPSSLPLHFKCKIDHKSYRSCSSPKTYRHLKVGKHKFRVKARDAAGNVDLTPAVKRFRIQP
jgi:hypothetical protein